ncbi:MAG: SGNH hydrolase domain-containing protein, partial [Desulforhopalus sp.]
FDLFHTGLTFQKKTRRTITFINDEGIPVKDHTSYYRARLSDTVNTLKQKGKDVIILKQVPLFDGAKDCNWEPRINQLLGKERICDYDTAFIGKWQQPSIDFIDEFTAAHQVPVFDPVPFFDRPLHDGTNLYGDSDHLNEYGKQFLVPYFVKAIDELMSGKIQKKASSITQMSQ